jgi:Uma2 family endonuclease
MNPPRLMTKKEVLMSQPGQWQVATWEEYVALRDDVAIALTKLVFNQGVLWIEMGGEGINHASVNNLFTMIVAFWAMHRPEPKISALGGCQLEKIGHKACAPDIVLYVGDDAPRWRSGERRFINLDRVRVPDLVGEISDTTLADDLDVMKHLYESLGIPEYWVVDIRGRRVLAFQLDEHGVYVECQASKALAGLAIALLEQTLEHLEAETNTDAARWFAQQITLID